MSETHQQPGHERLREGFHQHEAVLCDGCNQKVDLSDADDLGEALELWNEHMRKQHGGDD